VLHLLSNREKGGYNNTCAKHRDKCSVFLNTLTHTLTHRHILAHTYTHSRNVSKEMTMAAWRKARHRKAKKHI